MNIQTNFKLVEFNYELDLTEFYSQALLRGYINNSSQAKMIDCFKNERAWNAWIIYENQTPCGAVACHSLDIMGPNAYRMLARTCFFSEFNINKGLISKNNFIQNLQHAGPQIFMVAGIEWAGQDKDFYITTNDSKEASQRRVHSVWAPEMAKIGLLERVIEQEYRGHVQAFWKLNTDVFLEALSNNNRWLLQNTD
jgi:hypothetical protein